MDTLSNGSGLGFSFTTTVDSIREAVDRLEQMLPEHEDAAALLDFLEDDLRQGLDAISDIESHFTDMLDLLRGKEISPIALLEASEDFLVLRRLELLTTTVQQIRRRLSQAAGRLHRAPRQANP